MSGNSDVDKTELQL